MASTHEVVITNGVVHKRYRSWSNNEPVREWTALCHLHDHSPDLVPQPLSADLQGNPPVIVMSAVPGVSLDRTPGHHLDSLSEALHELWSVPIDEIASRLPLASGLEFAARLLDGRVATDLQDRAVKTARRWWDSGEIAVLLEPPNRVVLGHGDPNLANYLWDGHRVRIVDFEDAALSDPSQEAAILVEHLSCRHLDSDAIVAQLDIDPQRFLVARRVWAMFWLWMLLPDGPSSKRNQPDTADQQAARLLELIDRQP